MIDPGFIREKVTEHGFFVTAVFPTQDDDVKVGFAYSSGIQKTLAQPDVVIVGFDPRLCHGVISSLYEGLKSGDISIAPEGGLLERVIARFPVKMAPVPADMIERFAYATVNLNGAEPTVMHQMILPDENGKFPGDPGVNPEFVAFQDITKILTKPDTPAPGVN